MEKLFFFLLALELIYEVLRTTPFPGYAETAVGNLLSGFTGAQIESIFLKSKTHVLFVVKTFLSFFNTVFCCLEIFSPLRYRGVAPYNNFIP